ESMPAKRAGVLALATALKRNGVPIDGVGIQAHVVLPGPTRDTFAAIMHEYDEQHLLTAITELDVGIPGTVDDAKLQQQGEVYAAALGACRAAPNCRALITWGFTDRASWITRDPSV